MVPGLGRGGPTITSPRLPRGAQFLSCSVGDRKSLWSSPLFYTPEVGTQGLLGCGGPVMSGVPPAFPGREEEKCPTWGPCAPLDAYILSLVPCSMQIAWWHDPHPSADEDLGFGRVKEAGKDHTAGLESQSAASKPFLCCYTERGFWKGLRYQSSSR